MTMPRLRTIIIVLFATFITLKITFSWLRNEERSETVVEEEADIVGAECTPPPAYVFLKKHKTASTTFRQLIGHFNKFKGWKGSNEPQLIGPQGGCYPARFHERCWPAHGRNDPIKGNGYVTFLMTHLL